MFHMGNVEIIMVLYLFMIIDCIDKYYRDGRENNLNKWEAFHRDLRHFDMGYEEDDWANDFRHDIAGCKYWILSGENFMQHRGDLNSFCPRGEIIGSGVAIRKGKRIPLFNIKDALKEVKENRTTIIIPKLKVCDNLFPLRMETYTKSVSCDSKDYYYGFSSNFNKKIININ